MARFTLTIDSTKVSAPLTNFPVYVNLQHVKPGGLTLTEANSIRVYKADGVTQLAREIVNKDEMHFKADALSSTADTAFIIDIDGMRPDLIYTSTFGRNAVWSDTSLVYHLEDNPSAAAPQVIDSSPNGYKGTTLGGMTTSDAVPGKVGKGFQLDGAGKGINAGDVVDMYTDSLTASIWFKTTGSGSLIAKSLYGAATQRWALYIDSGNLLSIFHGTAGVTTTGISGLNDGQWHLAHAVFDRQGNLSVYVDGTLRAFENIASQAAVSINSDYVLLVGLYNSATGTAPHASALRFSGTLDEARVQRRAISPEWIATEYANQNRPDTFYRLGGNPPTVVLDTPNDTRFYTASPTLLFTGTDPEGDRIHYQVEITEDN